MKPCHAATKGEAVRLKWQAEHRKAVNAKWTGTWESTIPHKISACEITYFTK